MINNDEGAYKLGHMYDQLANSNSDVAISHQVHENHYTTHHTKVNKAPDRN